MTFTEKTIVTPDKTAKMIGSGGLDVFATPHMIALMEKAALNCVKDLQPEGFSTVGTEISVTHLKATKVGQEVSATATLTKQDGRAFEFTVVAKEGDTVIGEGVHKRFSVDIEKFLAKL